MHRHTDVGFTVSSTKNSTLQVSNTIMIHDQRCWGVSKMYTDQELAKALTKGNYTLCSGFELGKYWFLNDSSRDDKVTKWSVVKIGPPHMEIAKLHFRTTDMASWFVERLIAGRYEDLEKRSTPVTLWNIESAITHKCNECTYFVPK